MILSVKKTIPILTTTFLLFFIHPQLNAFEDTENTSASVLNIVESTKIEALTERLNEIESMELLALNSAEKKELQKEVNSINSELKTISKRVNDSSANSEAQKHREGVYLSLGALLIIIVLLIVLL